MAAKGAEKLDAETIQALKEVFDHFDRDETRLIQGPDTSGGSKKGPPS